MPASFPTLPASLPPIPPVFLSRSRVSDLLDRAHGRLTVVRAPGGSGKTLAVTDWLRDHHASERTVWLSADERASDYAAFWHTVASLLGTYLGDGALEDITRGFVSIDHAHEAVLDALNDPSGPDRLVIDDAHLIHPDATRELVRLTRRLRRTQMVVLTRRRGPFEGAAVIARTDALVITGADLAFDPDETELVVDEVVRSGRPRPRFTSASLHESTDGHPLSTRVALATLHARSEVDSTVVAQHTAEDLLPDSGAEREVALRIALSPVADDELGIALTGRDDAPQIIRAFEHEGLGEYGADGLFSFHALVRESFLRLAEAEFDEDERRRLLGIAAVGLARRPEWAVSVVQLACQARRLELVWGVFLNNFSDFLNHYRELLLEHVGSVPAELLIAQGTAACVLVVARSEDERRPSVHTLALADGAIAVLRAMPESTDPIEMFLRLLAIFGAHRTVRRYEEATAASDELIGRVLAMPAPLQAQYVVPISVSLLQFAITNVVSLRMDRAEQVLDLVHEPHPVRHMHRIALRGYIQAVRGRIDDSRATLLRLPGERIERWHAAVLAIGWHIARGVDRFERGDGTGAVSVLHDIVQRIELIEHWPLIIWASARAWLFSDDPIAGRERVRALLAENTDRIATSEARAFMLAAAADLELAVGSIEGAHALLREVDGVLSPATLLTRARLALAADDAAAAQGLSRRCLSIPDLWPRHRAEAYVVAAASTARLGRRDVARRLLHRAVALAEESGLRSPLLMISRAELEAINGGPVALLEDITVNPFATNADLRLTPREREVLQGLAEGLTLPQLADEFFVTRHTIKSQTRTLYRKLGVGSRHEAVALAVRRGLGRLRPPRSPVPK